MTKAEEDLIIAEQNQSRDIILKAIEKEKCELLGIIQGKDKAIKDLEWQLKQVTEDNDYYQAENERLEKEIKELKNQLFTLRNERNTFLAQNEQYEKDLIDFDENLTKAKEIIKKFSEFVTNEVDYDPEHPQEHTDLWNELCEQVEQFLKEVEK